jgi:hypothetical protein
MAGPGVGFKNKGNITGGVESGRQKQKQKRIEDRRHSIEETWKHE